MDSVSIDNLVEKLKDYYNKYSDIWYSINSPRVYETVKFSSIYVYINKDNEGSSNKVALMDLISELKSISDSGSSLESVEILERNEPRLITFVITIINKL